MIPEFPPDSFPGWIIWVGLSATVIGVAGVVSVPVGYGIRGVHRFVKRRTKADPEKEARQ